MEDGARRISLGMRALSQATKCPRDLLRMLLKKGGIVKRDKHDPMVGYSSDELASLLITTWLIMRMDCPFIRALVVYDQIATFVASASTVLGDRVVAVATMTRKGLEVQVGHGQGDLDIHPDALPHTWIFDATALRDEVEDRLWRSPLRLPEPKDCIVNS